MTKFISDIGKNASETKQCAFGELAYLEKIDGFFEEFIQTGTVCEGTDSSKDYSLGNEAKTVFPFSTTRTEYQYKQCCVGIPLLTGSTPNNRTGTDEFGNDSLWQVNYKTKYLMPLFGGYWGDGVGAGSFAQVLGGHRTYSYVTNGSRLAVI